MFGRKSEKVKLCLKPWPNGLASRRRSSVKLLLVKLPISDHHLSLASRLVAYGRFHCNYNIAIIIIPFCQGWIWANNPRGSHKKKHRDKILHLCWSNDGLSQTFCWIAVTCDDLQWNNRRKKNLNINFCAFTYTVETVGRLQAQLRANKSQWAERRGPWDIFSFFIQVGRQAEGSGETNQASSGKDITFTPKVYIS